MRSVRAVSVVGTLTLLLGLCVTTPTSSATTTGTNPGTDGAGSSGPSQKAAERRLRADAADPVVVRTGSDGRAEFVGTLGAPVAAPAALPATVTPTRAAVEHLDRYGELFGVHRPEAQLERTDVVATGDGSHVVKFTQTVDGLPVIGGELAVSVDADGDLESVNGEMTDPAVLPEPVVSAVVAVDTAVLTTSRTHGVPVPTLAVGPASRWYFDPELVRQPRPRRGQAGVAGRGHQRLRHPRDGAGRQRHRRRCRARQPDHRCQGPRRMRPRAGRRERCSLPPRCLRPHRDHRTGGGGRCGSGLPVRWTHLGPVPAARPRPDRDDRAQRGRRAQAAADRQPHRRERILERPRGLLQPRMVPGRRRGGARALSRRGRAPLGAHVLVPVRRDQRVDGRRVRRDRGPAQRHRPVRPAQPARLAARRGLARWDSARHAVADARPAWHTATAGPDAQPVLRRRRQTGSTTVPCTSTAAWATRPRC